MSDEGGVPLPKPPPVDGIGVFATGLTDDPQSFTLSSTLGQAIHELDLGRTPTNS